MRWSSLILLPLLFGLLACDSSDDDDGEAPPLPVANPTVEGPISNAESVPWVQATSFNLADLGYSQGEFFISGTADAYTANGELGSDGFWQASPAGTAEYKTRILVYRPIDPQDFNGTVVVEWFNVSGGLDAAPDWTATHTELIREGYAWVGVSAQRVGVEGGGGPFSLSLKAVNPTRYGSLNHPGDSFSYDIFSQAGQAVLAPDGIDPLDGLRPARMIAVGESQSAFRLTTYVNAVHPLVRLYDGFLIHSRGGSSAPLSQDPEPAIASPPIVFTRTDLREPVLTYQTETDLITLGYLPNRQEDSASFRLWEVAGTAHADTYTLVVGFIDQGNDPSAMDVFEVDDPIPGFIECDTPVNSGPQHVVLKAALAALDAWVRGGPAPPLSPRLEVAGEPPAFVLDELGNALGGIRTSWVDAPVATLSGLGQTGGTFCRIFGTTILFDEETLAGLYPDHASYIAAVNESVDGAVAAGFVRPADAELIKSAAEESDIGN